MDLVSRLQVLATSTAGNKNLEVWLQCTVEFSQVFSINKARQNPSKSSREDNLGVYSKAGLSSACFLMHVAVI